MRKTFAVVVACLALGGVAAADDAQAAMRKLTDIPAEGLGPALTTLATQFDFQVLFRTESVRNLKSQAAVGALTPDEALRKILSGTGLTYKYLDDKTVTIVPVSSVEKVGSPSDASESQEVGKKASRDFRLAQVDQGSSARHAGLESNQSITTDSANSTQLTEILVTAQKKTERLQDTPVPVTVVDTQALTDNNQLRLEDFFSQVPGLSMTTGVLSNEFLSIRGISNQIARGSATVGVVVDDAPFGMNTGVQPTDIDPGDLAQIEVLRGPQGTLYGASSMGGLLKYVMAEPSTESFSGRLQAGTSTIYNAANLGYNVRGSANIPLTDALAIRVSAFTREEPGYIDDVETGEEGVNLLRARGGHLAALWHVNDAWSLKLNAFYSDTVAQGVNYSDIPTVGFPETTSLTDLQQYRARGSGYSDTQVQQYSATLSGKIGDIDLKSITAYNNNRVKTTGDYSSYSYFSGLAEQYYNVAGAIAPQLAPMGAFSEELHLSGSLFSHLDWLVGGFFTHQYGNVSDSIQPENPLTGAQSAGNLFFENFPQDYREYAGFADFTWHVTDKFDVQVGGRESHVYQSFYYYSIGILNGPPANATYIEPKVETGANAFTYLVTPSYKITPDTMVYLRLASGFRAGTLNPTATGATFGAIPPAANPDKTYNYELGVKSDFLEHRLSLDASLYYIDWKNIQLLVLETIDGLTNSFTTNGNDAKSEGVELSLTARPLPGLTASGWVDYDNAVLKDGFPATAYFVGNAGDRLPFTSRFSAHLSLQQEFPIRNGVRGFVGGSIDYLGDRLGDFQGPGVARQAYSPYAKTDVQAGVKFGNWTINSYANNVTDRRGVLSTGVDFPPPASSVTYIQPRLIGVNASWTF